MSLTVRHLNGDSTFLLLFSPEPHPTTSDLCSANGAYSVLIDPWIIGSSIVSAKWFAVTDRVEPSAIAHLSELEEPDVVICSQNKPDHTHKETLLQLRPEGKTIIAAEPGAAKAIKSWNHFDPNRVYALVKYDPKAKFGNSLRLYIPPLSSEGLPGEIVISFIPAKNYVTGLHNAIGITYQAPTKSKALAPVTTIDLPKTKYFHLPMSPASTLGNSPASTFDTSPQEVYPPSLYQQSPLADSQETVIPIKRDSRRTLGHRPYIARSTNTASSELLSLPYAPSVRPSMQDLQRQQRGLETNLLPAIQIGDELKNNFNFTQALPTPPDSPNQPVRTSVTAPMQPDPLTPKTSISSVSSISPSQRRDNSRALSVSNKSPTVHPARPKAVSLLYSPHGITTSDLKPYIQNHLIRLPGALPLTLLLHSFEYAQNPWYLGGNIMTGAAGGMAIAKALMARCWISAHDEPKDKRGVSIKLLKTEYIGVEDIRRELACDEDGRGHGWTCDVRTLPCGKELTLSSSQRDLLVGSTSVSVGQGLGIENSTLMEKPFISAGA